MNILLLNVNIGKEWGWGGIESHSDILASELVKNGHRVVMGCWEEGSVAVQAGKLVLPSRRIRIRNSGDIVAIIKIIKTCLRDDIQVIIANGGREYWPAAIAAKISGTKIIFVRHQTDRIKWSTRWLINNYVERVIAVSGAVKNALIASGVSEEKIEIIHNSIALERFNPSLVNKDEVRQGLGIGSNDIVIGTVGKLNRGKGVYEILDALCSLVKEYPDLKLVYVGDGPERQGIEEEAQKLSVHDRVIFAGVRRDIEKMYSSMDIFVLPSTCDEAFGMVLIEAMAMGKPVIATTVGGIPEIIRDGVNGILISPGDSSAIADAIANLINNYDLAEGIASEGRRAVEHDFSAKVMGERFEEVLSKVS